MAPWPGPAGDTKLSAFWNMCFSKPPHFENRGADPANIFQAMKCYYNNSTAILKS